MDLRNPRRSVILVALAMACGPGCGDGSDGFGAGEAPRMEVWHGDRVVAPGDEVTLDPRAAGEVLATLVVENPGDADLEILDATLEVEPAGALALRADVLPAAGAPVIVCPLAAAACGAWTVDVVAVSASDVTPSEATLVLHTNRTLEGGEVRRIPLRAGASGPRIDVLPALVDVGVVPAGQTREQEVRVLNTGVAPLTVDAVSLLGHPGWSAAVEGAPGGRVEPTGEEGAPLTPPLVVPPGASRSLVVRYTAETVQPAEGVLVLHSDDPDGGAGTTVPLRANTNAPCVVVDPGAVDFGGKLVGTLATATVEVRSCGSEDLVVHAVHLDDGSAGSFDVVAPDLPVTLGPDDVLSVEVRFVAEGLAGLDREGQPRADEGTLIVASDAPVGEVEVPLRGLGVDQECPAAVIVVQEGPEVIPQTTLHLSGLQSLPVTEIVAYEWAVEQPDGSQEILRPSAQGPEVQLEANVAGAYTFRLRVTDANGCTSPAAEYTVAVVADQAIHVELLWDTPADPDQTDEGIEAGADLDLHFLHPLAMGADIDGDGAADGWFDMPYDCFWFNAHPNWGSLDGAVADDPGLDRDDTDGAGPENVNLDLPEDGATYRVGVHYWNDHGWGPSLATVRVYVFGDLAFEVGGVELQHGCLWSVAEIAWPSGEVTLVTGEGGAYDITCDVSPPGFPAP